MNQFPIHLNNADEFKKVFEDVDYILTDCDGVLWLHNSVIPGADSFINTARKLGKKIIFATNNSTKSRRIILNKLNGLGFQANLNEIMVTSYAAGIYLKKLNFPADKKVYVFGSAGLEEEFKLLNINFIGIGPDELPNNLSDFSRIELDNDVEAVVLGFDYDISYPKLIKACTYGRRILNTRPDLFIATNLDETLPTPFKNLCIPGTGALVNIISTAVGKQPVSMGKPGKFFFECIKEVHPNIKPERCLMIGDRLKSDIEFAFNNQFKYSIFVEGGVSSLDHIRTAIENKQHELVPTHHCENLGVLNSYFNWE